MAMAAALIVAALRGAFDAILLKLLLACVLGTFGLVGFMVLSVFLPVLKIQQALDK